jgi:hypothetical protein
VAQPALWTARLLAHCGLPDEPGVHSPHTTQRVVLTASALQVRRPINRDGLNVAAPYRTWLQPFVDAYGVPAQTPDPVHPEPRPCSPRIGG